MFLLRPIRFLAKALTAEATPRQCALGFAMGMVVGLTPKGNLTAIVLMMVMCASRVNLGAGMVSAFFFSWVGLLTDPLAHNIGLWLLTQESLEPFFTWLYNAPVAPWTAFNNTVVLGSVVLGLALVYPVYRLSRPPFERYVPRLQEKLRKRRIVAWLTGAEWTGKLTT